MAETQTDFQRLMVGVRAGNEESVRLLLERYKPPLFRVIRRRLHRELRSQCDSEDVLQSVWSSFFAIPARQFEFEDPAALKAYLVDMACNKVVEAIRRRLGTQKRNLNREKSLHGSAAAEAQTLRARTPTPSQVVMAKERWAHLIEGRPARHQRILLLLRQGKTQSEIAAELGITDRTVRRLIRELQPESPS
jgi:RNA polymerase sigma factor (sigma-70 family)